MTKLSSGYAGLDRRIAENGATSLWIGDQVQLRGHEPGDADLVKLFAHSADQRSGWLVQLPQSRVATRKFFEEEAGKQPAPDSLEFTLVIARREDDLMLGMINVHHADQVNGTFSYGVGIEPEHKGNGHAAEAVVLVLRFMFDERRFQKCEAGVYDYNAASLALHRKLGFVEEGRLRRHVFVGGEHRDEVRFGMTVEEFRELYPQLRPLL
ncbi:MAG TPA: GNAT family protein [Actinocrinis sp.]|nr:GNAT family protein [Actinocrinis sp.]